MQLPNSITTVTLLSKALAMILFVSLPFTGFYLGYKIRQPPVENKETIPSSSPTPTTTIVREEKFTDTNDFFVNSLLLSKLSGTYYNYGLEKPKRFSADITDSIKEDYPQIKLFQNVKPPAFFLNIWSYYHNTPVWTDQNQYVSFNDGKLTLFADIGIRSNKNYPNLTFANLKKEFGNVINRSKPTTSVFVINSHAVVISWKPTYLGRNGFDDHPSILATIYLDNPNNEESNALQLLVSLPSYLESDGVMSDNLSATSEDVIKYQKIIDSYFDAVVDILKNIQLVSEEVKE